MFDDQNWRNSYDQWKLASPYDDWEEPPEPEWTDEGWEDWEPIPRW